MLDYDVFTADVIRLRGFSGSTILATEDQLREMIQALKAKRLNIPKPDTWFDPNDEDLLTAPILPPWLCSRCEGAYHGPFCGPEHEAVARISREDRDARDDRRDYEKPQVRTIKVPDVSGMDPATPNPEAFAENHPMRDLPILTAHDAGKKLDLSPAVIDWIRGLTESDDGLQGPGLGGGFKVSKADICATFGLDDEETRLVLGEPEPDIASEHDRILKSLEDKLLQVVAHYQEALIWCSGEGAFGKGGVAHLGWKKLCVPLLSSEMLALTEGIRTDTPEECLRHPEDANIEDYLLDLPEPAEITISVNPPTPGLEATTKWFNRGQDVEELPGITIVESGYYRLTYPDAENGRVDIEYLGKEVTDAIFGNADEEEPPADIKHYNDDNAPTGGYEGSMAQGGAMRLDNDNFAADEGINTTLIDAALKGRATPEDLADGYGAGKNTMPPFTNLESNQNPSHHLSEVCVNCGQTYGRHKCYDDACPHPGWPTGGYREDSQFEADDAEVMDMPTHTITIDKYKKDPGPIDDGIDALLAESNALHDAAREGDHHPPIRSNIHPDEIVDRSTPDPAFDVVGVTRGRATGGPANTSNIPRHMNVEGTETGRWSGGMPGHEEVSRSNQLEPLTPTMAAAAMAEADGNRRLLIKHDGGFEIIHFNEASVGDIAMMLPAYGEVLTSAAHCNTWMKVTSAATPGDPFQGIMMEPLKRPPWMVRVRAVETKHKQGTEPPLAIALDVGCRDECGGFEWKRIGNNYRLFPGEASFYEFNPTAGYLEASYAGTLDDEVKDAEFIDSRVTMDDLPGCLKQALGGD